MKKTNVIHKPRRWVDEHGEERFEMCDPYVEIGDFIKFMITYDDDIEDSKVLRHFGTSFSLFYKLLKHVVWDTCYVYPVGRVKKDICAYLGIKAAMFEEHLRRYRKIGIMKKIDDGTYMINPTKFYMGDFNKHIDCCKKYSQETDGGVNGKL